MTPSLKHTAVVAIDFGTATTGYAFAFSSSPSDIYINKTWPRGPVEAKTLTQILLTKSLSVVSFGYEARDKFASMTEMERKNHLYFSDFKMVLHNQSGAKRSAVKASNCNTEICVKKLISLCIGEVKNRALSELCLSSTVAITASDVLWVITVPAIWDFAAREAMKEAAEMSGIAKENAYIALEPEAATLYCVNRQMKFNLQALQLHKFMVVDAGGGTVDITVHLAKSDGTLAEVHVPSGGNWGSTYVNKEFENLLEELYGAAHIKTIKGTENWNDLMDSFENVKQKFQDSPSEPRRKNFAISNLKGSPKIANLSKYAGLGIELSDDTLRIPTIALRQLFLPIIDKIANHIQYLLNTAECRGVKYLFLVGGFSECPLVKRGIENKIGHKVQFVSPPRPVVSVLNGAVQYGFNPVAIASRIALRTVGVAINGTWDDKLHKGRQSVVDCSGEKVCSEIFDTFVSVQDHLDVNATVCRNYIPTYSHQKIITFPVCTSLKKHVPFYTDSGVTKIGELTLEIPEPNLDPSQRKVEVEMKFGGPVFSVTASYVRTGKNTKADFTIPLDI